MVGPNGHLERGGKVKIARGIFHHNLRRLGFGAVLLFFPMLLRAELSVLPLNGAWNLALGSAPETNLDLSKIQFRDTIQLPGTTDTNRKGLENTENRTEGLTRPYKW